ncbi:MAG: multidrug effflux MFS transporter [bacterium]|nr:multidrug effflux MFS transporter [bacterium]
MKKNILSIPSLLLVVSLAAINSVLYTPALPALTKYYGVTQGEIQYTVAIFVIGYSISQLVYGPIANAIGRKKTVLLGFSIGIIGALLCILSGLIKNYELLIISRFIVGFGTASGLCLTFTMINDVSSEQKAKKITGFCFMAFAIAPGAANFIGGYLTSEFGATGSFYFLLLFNIIVFVIALKIPETLSIRKRSKLKVSNIINDYINALKNKTLLVSSLIYGLFCAVLYGIIAILPFIAISQLKLSPELFGLLFFLSYLGYLAGSFIATAISHKLKTKDTLLVGIAIALLVNIMLIGLIITSHITVASLFICIFLIFISLPFIFINASVLGITSHSDKSNASSVMNFTSTFMAFLSVTVVGSIHSDFLYLLGFGILFLLLFSLALYTFFFCGFLRNTLYKEKLITEVNNG